MTFLCHSPALHIVLYSKSITSTVYTCKYYSVLARVSTVRYGIVQYSSWYCTEGSSNQLMFCDRSDYLRYHVQYGTSYSTSLGGQETGNPSAMKDEPPSPLDLSFRSCISPCLEEGQDARYFITYNMLRRCRRNSQK